MARPRNPERNRAMEKYIEKDGKITTKELAEAAGVTESRIRKWKSEDKWKEALAKKPRKRGAQPGNKNAAGKTPAKYGNKNAVTHGAFAQAGIEDITPERAAEIMALDEANVMIKMADEMKGLLVRKAYLEGLLDTYTDPDKQDIYYTDKIVHMVVPVSVKEKMQAEAEGRDIESADDPEHGNETLKTAMKTVIKSSPFDRAMKVEGELNRLNGRIIKLLDSMRAHETDAERIQLEKEKHKLSKQKATGAFEIDPEEEEEE